jgi:hypothetical protein
VSVSDLLIRIQEELAGYDSLTAKDVGDEIHITGRLDIGLGDEDSFDIQIILDGDYPRSFPRTYETAGRVPRVLDRHYYTGDDAGCCLCIPHLLRTRFPVGSPISVYIDQLVVPYFKNQVHYEITGKYVAEYGHGFAGIYEFYAEHFGISDPQVLARLVEAVYMHSIGGARPCPCGGKRKQRKCHLKSMKRLKQLTHDGQLALDVHNFNKYLEIANRSAAAEIEGDKRLSA